MLLFRFRNSFWHFYKRSLRVLMHKNHSYWSVKQHCIYLLSETLGFTSCIFKALLPNNQSALIGQRTHAWASTVHHLRLALSAIF